jgi:hypothetical protein
MIASIFSKSRPFNNILIVVTLVLSFLIYQIQQQNSNTKSNELVDWMANLGTLLTLIASLFITNFITKRNELSKDNSYSILFFIGFLLFIPIAFSDSSIVISNFFILLAMRRLISMKSMVTPKEKIFDASLWIFIAALFYFWSILFIVIVFVSIVFHVSGDYRNWTLPFIAFFAVGIIFLFFALLFDKAWIYSLWDQIEVDFTFFYLERSAANAAFILFGLFSFMFFILMVFTLSKRPIIMLASYKKVIYIYLISALIYVISPEKNNALLLYSIMPLSVFATAHIEIIKDTILKEIIVGSVLTFGMLLYIFQL